jgi:hypothetical protein
MHWWGELWRVLNKFPDHFFFVIVMVSKVKTKKILLMQKSPPLPFKDDSKQGRGFFSLSIPP